MSQLSEWIESELDDRKWSQNELARRSNIASSRMSSIMDGAIPGIKACRGIAKALEVEVQFVLQKAGHDTPRDPLAPGDIDDYDRRILEVLHGMDDQFKSTVLKTVKAWRFYEEHRERSGNE
jgi:transcriptional regulator with XRE-family HTH domain